MPYAMYIMYMDGTDRPRMGLESTLVGILNDIHPNGRMTIPFDREKKTCFDHLMTHKKRGQTSKPWKPENMDWSNSNTLRSGNQAWQLKIPYKWI